MFRQLEINTQSRESGETSGSSREKINCLGVEAPACSIGRSRRDACAFRRTDFIHPIFYHLSMKRPDYIARMRVGRVQSGPSYTTSFGSNNLQRAQICARAKSECCLDTGNRALGVPLGILKYRIATGEWFTSPRRNPSHRSLNLT